MIRIVFALLVLAVPLRAEELAEKGLKEACGEIARVAIAVAREEGGLHVAVGEFSYAGAGTFNTEAAIQAELIVALGTQYDEEGTIKIIGSYNRIDGAVSIDVKINRTDGKQLTKAMAKFKEHTASVTKITDQAKLIPGSKAIPPLTPADPKDPKPTPQERREALGKKSTAFVREGTLVQPCEGSAYAVEIRTKTTLDGASTPLRASVKNGEASVPEIPINRLYEVRLLNFGKQEVSAQVSVDGLSEFHFTKDRKTDGSPAYIGTIVPAAVGDKPGEAVIVGWHDRFDRANKTHHFQSFLVTAFGQGAVSKLPNPPRGKVGVVSVAFALTFPEGTQRGGGETGFGPPKAVSGEVVKRVTDPPHEFVAIRYQRPQK